MNGNNDANHISEDDLVLFALQLLPDERMTQAMAHLQTCTACRAEIANIQGDLAAYSMTAEPVPPPAGSRDRFMRQIAREPRVAELPAFDLKPTEFDRREAEKLALAPKPDPVAPVMEERPQERLHERFDRIQDDRSHERAADRIQDRHQEPIADRAREDRTREDRTHDRREDRIHDRAGDHAEDRPSDLPFPDRRSSRRSADDAFPPGEHRILTRGTRRGDDENVEVYREERRSPRRTPWVLAWTGWAVAAGCSFVAGLQLHQRQHMQGSMATQQAQMDDMQKQMDHADAALSTLTAANAMQVALHETPPLKPATATGTKGTPPPIAPEALAAYLADKGALVFVATHLQPAPAGKTYELWLLPASGQSPIPAGTFKPDAQGGASVVMPKLPKGVPAKGFGVTVENDGGSPTPTLPIVMS